MRAATAAAEPVAPVGRCGVLKNCLRTETTSAMAAFSRSSSSGDSTRSASARQASAQPLCSGLAQGSRQTRKIDGIAIAQAIAQPSSRSSIADGPAGIIIGSTISSTAAIRAAARYPLITPANEMAKVIVPATSVESRT